MPRRDLEKYLAREKKEILTSLGSYHKRWNRDLIERAFDFASDAHKSQLRQSGEPYIVHPIAVAKILIELKTDYIAVAAGLLHDVVEDTGITIEEVRERFGDQVALLVDGVTKISEIRFRSHEERQAESIRKMLLSMLKDLRVILIKLADRLHNMRTISSLPPKSRMRIAVETRDVYSPLAHRLGIARLAREMEDHILHITNPQVYAAIRDKLAKSLKKREAALHEIIEPIRAELTRQGVQADVHGRVKSVASIHQKNHSRGKSINEIYDMLAIRIIVTHKPECYRVLGLVHDIFTPVTDHFMDHIALPKSNLYQSLHTKVRDAHNRIVEVQIRTHEMHALAENGIAAHWRYKAGHLKPDDLDEEFIWIRSLMEAHQEGAETGDFMESLKVDLFQDEIFVFTPTGELIKLPRNATPVDFAFAIHSDIGLHAIGAKIGGKITPLNHELSSGDIVEILTSTNQQPSVEWLKSVRTSRARSHIKRWMRETKWNQAKGLGEEIIHSELKRLKLRSDNNKLSEVALTFGFTEKVEFFAAIGAGQITVGQVMRKLMPMLTPDKESLISRIVQRPGRTAHSVRVSRLDSQIIEIADCCNPLPGDPIIGFQTSGEGLQVHRTDCNLVAELLKDRAKVVSVAWDVEHEDRFKARLHIVADDRPNLLRDITQVIASAKVNLQHIEMRMEDNLAIGFMIAEVRNLPHLTKLIAGINRIRGILKAERHDVEPGAPQDGDNGRRPTQRSLQWTA